MDLKNLYKQPQKVDKDGALDKLNNLLFTSAFLGFSDIDIGTKDYIKVEFKGTYVSGDEFDFDYSEKVEKTIIKSEKGTEKYEKELKIYNEYIRRLDSTMAVLKEKVSPEFIEGLLDSILEPYQKQELLETGEFDFAISREYGNFRINVSFQDLSGDEVGLYFSIRKGRKTPFTTDEMGVTDTMLKKFSIGQGLILISGPTGSAKSSTLISILNRINQNKSVKVVMLEDPIEFYWAELQKKAIFRQRSINGTVGSFARGIRAAMRQDPDIIVVGELRDRESIEAAIEAAGTGHLVIATVHVSSTIQVLDRLLGFFEGADKSAIGMKLSTSLKFVLNQRLFVDTNGKYKVAYEWLDPTADGVGHLIRDNNLQDVKKKMYELDTLGKAPHKTLNESLFEYVCSLKLPYTLAYEELSYDQKAFESNFSIFVQRWCEEKNIDITKLQEELLVVDNFYKAKNKLTSN